MLGSLNRIGVPLGACVLLLPGAALASFDCPGRMDYEFFADEECKHFTLETLPVDAEFNRGSAGAFFSSDASEFGEDGSLIWSVLDLAGPEGRRTGMLKLDLKFAGALLAGPDDLLFPNGQARAAYHEKSGDQVLFTGEAVFGNIWLRDAFLVDDEDSALQLEFVLIFADPGATYPGSRVLIGTLRTQISPADRRWQHSGLEEETHVESGCDGEVYVEEDEGSGCDGDGYDDGDSGCGGGDDYYEDSSDCEGDSYDSGGSDCEGDSGGYDSSSCEGDTTSSGDYGGCESDTGDSGACDDAYAAGLRPRRRSRGGPLRAVMRFFPEIAGVFFITRMRRRYRRSY